MEPQLSNGKDHDACISTMECPHCHKPIIVTNDDEGEDWDDDNQRPPDCA
jgi:hypothetical protein